MYCTLLKQYPFINQTNIFIEHRRSHLLCMYVRKFAHKSKSYSVCYVYGGYVYVTGLDEDAPSVTNADEGRPLLFEWVKDYEMKVQSHQMEDSFLFYLDERSVC